jgi:hypothetical protein
MTQGNKWGDFPNSVYAKLFASSVDRKFSFHLVTPTQNSALAIKNYYGFCFFQVLFLALSISPNI